MIQIKRIGYNSYYLHDKTNHKKIILNIKSKIDPNTSEKLIEVIGNSANLEDVENLNNSPYALVCF